LKVKHNRKRSLWWDHVKEALRQKGTLNGPACWGEAEGEKKKGKEEETINMGDMLEMNGKE